MPGEGGAGVLVRALTLAGLLAPAPLVLLTVRLVLAPGLDEYGFLTLGRVRVGFDQKVRVSGSGIVHIVVIRLILWSFCVIPFHARGQS